MYNSKMRDKKGVALIGVIFALLFFAVLGWTLVVMQSTDFEANVRSLQSERALHLAETGGQWALGQLSLSFGCDAITAATFPHNFKYGQYSCTCDDSVENEIAIVSTGYVPSQADYRAKRCVKVVVTQAGFGRAMTVKNLFSWYSMHAGSEVEGDITAGHWNGDNISPYDVLGSDYGPGVPDGTGARELGVENLPRIKMSYLKAKAQGWGRYKNYSAQAWATGSGGTSLRVATDLFNASMVGEAVRVVGDSVYQWPNEDSWAVIAGYVNPREITVELKPSVGLNNISVWNNKFVRAAKRFNGNNNNQQVWYIEGSDIIIDVRSTAEDGNDSSANFNTTSLVAEGDFLISGSKSLSMLAYVDASAHETFANIATENGNIYSLFTPEGSTETQKKDRRDFDGLVYTRTGSIFFNYLEGAALMGYNVTVDGLVDLEYEGKYVDSDAFMAGFSKITWEEQ